MSDADYAAYLDDMAQTPAVAWIDTDGALHLEHIPGSLAPPLGKVDSPVVIQPDEPSYPQYAQTVLRYYDYTGLEVPDAQGADDGSGGG